MEEINEKKQIEDRKYWRKWYISLFLWLIVLIILFYLFTKKYA